MKKNLIYFADLVHNDVIKSNDTFPLGVGLVASYLQQQHSDVKCDIFKMPEDLNEALLEEMPTIMCFSNFTWNLNISIEFAKYIRSVNPNIPIVFGGPNIPIPTDECEEFLKKYPEIDFYIKFDGEHAFENLYQKLLECDMDVKKVKNNNTYKLDNTLYVHENNIWEGPVKRIQNLMSVPSPYNLGLMDKFFKQDLRPLVEWTRGCPFSCSFCNDAVSIRNKIYRKTFDYVDDELEYMGNLVHKNNLYADLSIADLNFGMFKEDLIVAKKIRKITDKYSWPRSIDTSLGKSQPDRVLETVNILNSGDQPLYKMYSAFQSTDPIVLDAIRRKNLPIEKIKELKADTNVETSSTGFFSELILGLPKESKISHFNSLKDMIDGAGADSLDVHQLNLAMGAPMGTKKERAQWGLTSKFRIFIGRIGNYKVGNKMVSVGEHDEVVIGSKDLSYDDWIECRQVDFLVKVFLDRAYFSEIFEFITCIGLSKFDLLLMLYKKFIRKNKKLDELMNFYTSKVEGALHDTLEDFDKFVTDKENVEKYRDGIIGGNELTVSRAKMYTEALPELHEVLKQSAIAYLEENKLDTVINRQYVEEAAKFSYCRKFTFANFDKKIIEPFNFDFEKASLKSFKIDPKDYLFKNKESKSVDFFYKDSALEELAFQIKHHIRKGTKDDAREQGSLNLEAIKSELPEGQFNYNIGKFFHHINMTVLKRTFKYANS